MIRNEVRAYRRRALQIGRGCLGGLGLADVAARMLGRSGAIVLMYHSVGIPEMGNSIDPANQISLARFRSHIEFLATSRSVVSLGALVRMMTERQPISRGTVAITFDDGYLDAIQYAAPILQTLNIPATFYLPTRYIDQGQNQWIDCLYSAFMNRSRHSLSFNDQSRWDLSHTDSRSFRTAYAECARRLLNANMTARQMLLDEIIQQLLPSATLPRLTATWDEIRSCADRCPLIEFGGHTREHIDLAAADESTAKEEISASMDDVARELQRPVSHFSFPYCRSRPWHSEWMKAQGWTSGVADGDALLIGHDHNPYRLPRLDTNLTTEQLRFLTSGLSRS